MTQAKVFSGSEIMAQAIRQLLEQAGIEVLVRDDIESGRLAGFGTLDRAVEIFVKGSDFIRANQLVQSFLQA